MTFEIGPQPVLIIRGKAVMSMRAQMSAATV